MMEYRPLGLSFQAPITFGGISQGCAVAVTASLTDVREVGGSVRLLGSDGGGHAIDDKPHHVKGAFSLKCSTTKSLPRNGDARGLAIALRRPSAFGLNERKISPSVGASAGSCSSESRASSPPHCHLPQPYQRRKCMDVCSKLARCWLSMHRILWKKSK